MVTAKAKAINTKVENINLDDFILACISCGTKESITQIAHRNDVGKVVGYIFVCKDCFKFVSGGKLRMEW